MSYTSMVVAYDSGELAAPATSITIPDLNGDVDEEYELIVRAVNGVTASNLIRLRFNNDSGSNYGRQRLYGLDTTKPADRGVGDHIAVFSEIMTVAGQINFCHTKIKAKSGYVRTVISKSADVISTTTVTSVHISGQSWNNTADNLTSMVLVADNASGLGIGSRVILLKKSSSATTKTWEEIYRTEIAPSVIAIDTSTDGGAVSAASLTWAHTCSGSNRILIVTTLGTNAAADKITGITYAGQALTKISGIRLPAERWIGLWYIIAPATGANNIVVSASGVDYLDCKARSYTGVDQVTQPNAQTTNSTASATSLATSLVAGVEQCWYVAAVGASITSVTGMTAVYGAYFWDTNGAVSSGSHTYTCNRVSAEQLAICLATLTPFGAVTSLTIPSLTGNTDVLYRLRARVVNGYNGTTTLQLRLNNDTETNYGYQYLQGNNTTASAERNTATGFVGGAMYALGEITQREYLISAKSGYVRTCIDTTIDGIATTTVTQLRLFGQSWNNTADELTSLVIVASQANGLGVGSSVSLERLNL